MIRRKSRENPCPQNPRRRPRHSIGFGASLCLLSSLGIGQTAAAPVDTILAVKAPVYTGDSDAFTNAYDSLQTDADIVSLSGILGTAAGAGAIPMSPSAFAQIYATVPDYVSASGTTLTASSYVQNDAEGQSYPPTNLAYNAATKITGVFEGGPWVINPYFETASTGDQMGSEYVVIQIPAGSAALTALQIAAFPVDDISNVTCAPMAATISYSSDGATWIPLWSYASSLTFESYPVQVFQDPNYTSDSASAENFPYWKIAFQGAPSSYSWPNATASCSGFAIGYLKAFGYLVAGGSSGNGGSTAGGTTGTTTGSTGGGTVTGTNGGSSSGSTGSTSSGSSTSGSTTSGSTSSGATTNPTIALPSVNTAASAPQPNYTGSDGPVSTPVETTTPPLLCTN